MPSKRQVEAVGIWANVLAEHGYGSKVHHLVRYASEYAWAVDLEVRKRRVLVHSYVCPKVLYERDRMEPGVQLMLSDLGIWPGVFEAEKGARWRPFLEQIAHRYVKDVLPFLAEHFTGHSPDFLALGPDDVVDAWDHPALPPQMSGGYAARILYQFDRFREDTEKMERWRETFPGLDFDCISLKQRLEDDGIDPAVAGEFHDVW